MVLFIRLMVLPNVLDGWRPRNCYSIPNGGKRNSTTECSDRCWAPPGFRGCTLWVRGLIGLGLEAYDLPPSSVEIKKKWVLPFTFPHVFTSSTFCWVKNGLKEIFKEVFEPNLGHNADVCLEEVPSNSSGQSVWGPGFEPENSWIPKKECYSLDLEFPYAEFDTWLTSFDFLYLFICGLYSYPSCGFVFGNWGKLIHVMLEETFCCRSE